MNGKHADEPDREPFTRLLMQPHRGTRTFLRSLLPTATDVDEVLQDAGVLAWRKHGELDSPDKLQRRVSVIARYEALTASAGKKPVIVRSKACSLVLLHRLPGSPIGDPRMFRRSRRSSSSRSARQPRAMKNTAEFAAHSLIASTRVKSRVLRREVSLARTSLLTETEIP